MAQLAQPIRVEGLREFQRSLRTLDATLPRTLRLAQNKAADIVVDWAKPRVPSRSGKARGSVRATSSQREARVTGGGARVPYYPWLDFGGRVGPAKSVHREIIKGGRYIYEGYTQRQDDVQQVLIDALIDVARAAGIEVD